MQKEEIYDAIVVGSGATGGWAAKELTENGMRVLVLEAGRKLDPEKDFTEHAWPYDVKYRGTLGSRTIYRERQAIPERRRLPHPRCSARRCACPSPSGMWRA